MEIDIGTTGAAAGNASGDSLTSGNYEYEVYGDKKVTAKDALEILRHTINMSNNDRIGQNVDIA